MGLSIDVTRVTQVLLADGWHKVDLNENTSSFSLDAYEFIQTHVGKADDVLHGSGQGGVCSTGATWQEKGASVFCPLTAILAVRYDPKGKIPRGFPIGVGKPKPRP